MNNQNDYIEAAQQIIVSLGLPRAQQNERSALCLLALLNLTPGKAWADAENPLVGITPIMDWAREHYGKEYAPNTRETFRRQSMHQFCDAGVALYNPDKPDRPVNSPKAVYQIEPAARALLRTFGTPAWHDNLAAYLAERETLVARYAKEREQNLIPVEIAPGQQITLSPGEHSELIRAIIEDFAPRFAPGSVLVYAGDTGDKWGYFDAALLAGLAVRCLTLCELLAGLLPVWLLPVGCIGVASLVRVPLLLQQKEDDAADDGENAHSDKDPYPD